MGDTVCNPENDFEVCGYDGGDCCHWHLDNDATCSQETCLLGGDGNCNEDNNNQICNYDDGDCCLPSPDCLYCSGFGCLCHETGQIHCQDYQGK